jgi:hypothetical protein
MAIVHQDYEVREILASPGAVAIRNLQPEVVILDVRFYFRVGLGDAAEFGFPVTIQMTQLMWQRRESVSQRDVREVVKPTLLVDPVGL